MIEHGRPGTYNQGCRCAACTQANTERCASYRERHSHRVRARKRTWWLTTGADRRHQQRTLGSYR